MWSGSAARFKNLSSATVADVDAITSYGKAVAAVLVAATLGPPTPGTWTAHRLREVVLASGVTFVQLADLLALSWSLGIPTAHLKVFPRRQKRMAAMSVRISEKYAVLLAKDSRYPAPIAFYLAHELAHIVLGHLASSDVVVDFEDDLPGTAHRDPEEMAADQFALELLTGNARLEVESATGHASPRELARVALSSGPKVGIEPGSLALAFGYSSGRWKTANAALKYIYSEAKPVRTEVNRVAMNQLDTEQVSPDSIEYLKSVLGSHNE